MFRTSYEEWQEATAWWTARTSPPGWRVRTPSGPTPTPTIPDDGSVCHSDGPGSVGRFGRRLVAIIIDWTLCQLIAYAWLGVRLGEGSSGSWWPLVIFGVENLLLLSTLGSTFGQRLLGLRLLSMSGGRATVLQVLSRTVLLCLAIPALIWDRDQRGLHDKAAQTVLVRR